jgi:hypothetical protein
LLFWPGHRGSAGSRRRKESIMKLDVSSRPVSRRRGWRVSAALGAAAGFLVLPSVAHAQQVVVVNQGESRGEYRGPSWMLLSSGLIIFGGTYTASLVVAATSDHAGDRALYAPLVGPWLDIATRCPGTCDHELGRKVLLGFDGVFQGIGALTIVGSFLVPRRSRGIVARGETAPTFRVLPASYGRGAPGLTAVGTF